MEIPEVLELGLDHKICHFGLGAGLFYWRLECLSVSMRFIKNHLFQKVKSAIMQVCPPISINTEN